MKSMEISSPMTNKYEDPEDQREAGKRLLDEAPPPTAVGTPDSRR